MGMTKIHCVQAKDCQRTKKNKSWACNVSAGNRSKADSQDSLVNPAYDEIQASERLRVLGQKYKK